MDACLEIIIDSEKLPEGVISEASNQSAFGVIDNDGIYFWGDYVKVQQIDMPKHILTKLPDEYDKLNLNIYSVSGDCLDMLAREANGEPVNWDGNSLLDLVNKMLESSKKWAIVFEPNCDTIHYVKEYMRDDVLDLLKTNLASDYKGFVVYGCS